jgi:hypothetical protein
MRLFVGAASTTVMVFDVNGCGTRCARVCVCARACVCGGGGGGGGGVGGGDMVDADA